MATFFPGSLVPALDANGTPMNGALWYFYRPGTTTLSSVYADADLGTALSNPVVADSAGRFPAIYLAERQYRAILKDSDGNTVSRRDIDPINPDALAVANVLAFGADPTGVADSSGAIRQAIDSLPTGGGTVIFPAGVYSVTSTVILPIKDYGLELRGYRAQIVGSGIGSHTIFETGKGATSVGGVTSWGEPNETYLHRALIIRGMNFRSCGTGIKAFNAIWGSRFEDNWFDSFTTAIRAKRCFYAKLLNNQARPNDAARGASTPIFWLEESNNVMWIEGNSAGGIVGGATKTGVGWLFEGGLAGLLFSNNSAEGCVTGLSITGEVTGAAIIGNYFEANTSAIDLGSAGKSGLDIDDNWFAFNTTDIGSSAGWVTGSFGESNYFIGTPAVNLSGATNTMTVELPAVGFTELTHSTASLVPTGYSLSAAAEVIAPRYIYDSGSGVAGQRFRTAPGTTKDGMAQRYYTGAVGEPVNNLIPFCSITNNATAGVGTVVINTNIDYSATCFPVDFHLRIDDSVTAYTMIGFVYNGTAVIEHTAAGKTITPSNNGGKLRITVGNFDTTNFVGGMVTIRQ